MALLLDVFPDTEIAAFIDVSSGAGLNPSDQRLRPASTVSWPRFEVDAVRLQRSPKLNTYTHGRNTAKHLRTTIPAVHLVESCQLRCDQRRPAARKKLDMLT